MAAPSDRSSARRLLLILTALVALVGASVAALGAPGGYHGDPAVAHEGGGEGRRAFHAQRGASATSDRVAAPGVVATLINALTGAGDTEANPGDGLRYTATLSNTGADPATGVTFTAPIDPNETLVPGSLRVSPVGFNDTGNAIAQVAQTVAAPGLLGNDFLGTPAAPITSFGGGTLSGTPTTYAAGTTVSPIPSYATGSLTVNADGSYSFTAPTGFTGPFSFQYRVSNSAGADAATVTITVSAPVAPVAVNEGPSPTSVPGDPFHTAFNAPYTLAAPGVLGNDNAGTPAVGVASFGGGSLGGTVTSNAAGSTATFGTGGSLTVGANGSIAFTPSTGFTGPFTFQYRLQNVAGTSDATVTIAVGVRPAAVNDTYSPTLIGNVPVNTAVSTSFSVLTNDTGSSLVPAVVSATNGTATVNANGTFTFTPNAGYGGAASITYSVTNGFGTVQATVALTVGTKAVWFVNGSPTLAPDAGGSAARGERDGTVPRETRGEPEGGALLAGDGRYATPYTCLAGASCLSTGPVDANDVVYIASGTYTGGFTLPSGVIIVGQGASASLATVGSLTPPTDSPALPATGGTAPTITNGYTLGQNQTIRGVTFGTSAAGAAITGTGFGTLTTAADVTINNASNAALSLNNGTLAGALGTLTSGGGTNNVSLTGIGTTGTFALGSGALTGASGASFNVSGGSGTFTYNGNITQANNAALVNVAGTNTGSFTFQTGTLSATGGTGLQFNDADGTYSFNGTTTLNGGDAGIDVTNGSSGTFTFGTGTTITNPSGTGVTVANSTAGLTYSGNVSKSSANALVAVTTHSGGTITFQTGTLSATNGTGLQFDNADGTYNFNGTTTLNGGDAGIDVISGSSGTFTFASAASITNPANALVDISGSAPTFTYAGSLTRNAGSGAGITASNNTGGTVTFSGTTKALTTTGSTAAVNLTSNTNATFAFTNGGLAITTATGNGFTATGGGTVTVEGAPNTITSVGGVALNVRNTNIGTNGLTFRSINANGGAGGIVLVSTGPTGGLTVTGNSAGDCGGDANPAGSATAPVTADCTGGTIQNTTGADNDVNGAGNGVYLSNTRAVSLTRVRLNGHTNHAIYGTNVVGFTLDNVYVTGVNGDNVSVDDGSISFDNLTGSAAIQNTFVEGGFEDNIRVVNNTGTLNRLTVSNVTVGFNGATGNDGVLIAAYLTAVMNATVQNSRFNGSRSNNVQFAYSENSAGDAVISGNRVSNTHPQKLGSDFGIYVAHASSGAVTYAVTSNTVNNAGGSGIEVDRLVGGTGTMTGSITNNTVGTTGVAGSGSAAGSAIFIGLVGAPAAGVTATHNSTVTGNTIRQYANYGIRIANRGTGNGYLNTSIKNNNVGEPAPAAASFSASSAIRAELGAASHTGEPGNTGPDDGRTCLDISGNVLSNNTTTTQATLRIFGRFGTRTALPGLSGDPNLFLAAQNTITPPSGGTAVNATSTNAFQSSCAPTFAPSAPGAPTGSVMRPNENAPAVEVPTVSTGTPEVAGAVEAGAPAMNREETGGPVVSEAKAPAAAESTDAVAGLQTEKAPAAAVVAAEEPAVPVAVTPPVATRATEADDHPSPVMEALYRTAEPVLLAAADRLNSVLIAADAFMDASRTAPAEPAEVAVVDVAAAAVAEVAPTRHAMVRGRALRRSAARPLTLADVTAAIGTLPAGKSVTVIFDVTINNPFPYGVRPSVQGTVSGSNFANVLTDDPDVAGASNPTVTDVVQTVTRSVYFDGAAPELDDAGWRLLSTPVTGFTVNNLAAQNLVQGVPDYYPTFGANLLTGYDGAAFSLPTGGAFQLQPGRGFFWYLYDRTVTLPGQPSQSYPLPFTLNATGPVTFGPVTLPLNTTGDRWSMLGNPWPSPLDVSGFATWAVGGTVQATPQVWDDEAQTYVLTTMTSNQVPVWRGMFVESNAATALAIPASAQVTAAPPAQEPAAAEVSRDARRVRDRAGREGTGRAGADRGTRLQTRGRADDRGVPPAEVTPGTRSGGRTASLTGSETPSRGGEAIETRLLAFELAGTAAETGRPTLDRAAVLYFHPGAQAAWDAFDATKLSPPTSAYALLAFVGERDGRGVLQAQHSRAFELAGALELPLQVEARGTTGPLTLSWPTLVNVPAEWELSLRDNLSGEQVDLRQATGYTFDAASVGAPAQGPAALLERGRLGTLERSGGARFTLVVAPRSTAGGPGVSVPTALALTGISPNPSTGTATITFDVPAGAGDVTVEVYDMLGRRVASVVTGPQPAGRHVMPWHAGALPSGTYLVRMSATDGSGVPFDQTRTLTIAR